MKNWSQYIFSSDTFQKKAWNIYSYQRANNPVYRRYCKALQAEPDPKNIEDIPLLSARAFKDADLFSGPDEEPDLIFKSSGTGSMSRSVHRVADADLYRRSVVHGFNQFYDLEESVILAYTPGYADNPDSSLIWMLKALIDCDKTGLARFLPLEKSLQQSEVDCIEQSGKRLILFGAAFGLLELVEQSTATLPNNSTVIETGGMKTHRREISRQDLHRRLAGGFDLAYNRIHSEYGMTELLSQAYATGGKWFRTVPWMQISIRNPDNPQKQLPDYRKGLIGVMDLANVYSCSFILTGDEGVMDDKGRVQVLGRWNPKDLRGCNFLIDED